MHGHRPGDDQGRLDLAKVTRLEGVTEKPRMSDTERVAHELVLNRAPGYLLRRLDSRAAALFEEFTSQTELTPRQFGVLLTLYQRGTLSQTELGSRLHLDRSTLAEMLQRMVDRTLIDRRAHETDRRAIEVTLTRAGRSALLKTVEQTVLAQQALLAPLPEYLRPVFLKCLEILADEPADAGE
jgi:DNA-binding MarR family transcriptional regulator